jgi:hypothetical protein
MFFALPPTPDIAGSGRDFAFVPISDIVWFELGGRQLRAARWRSLVGTHRA